MTDHNPVELEEAIRDCSNRISKGVTICARAYEDFKFAERAYEQAYAKAYLDFAGAAHEKKPAAVRATAAEKQAMDEADVMYRYADRRAKALEAELRALQSVGASIRSMYGVAGRGEGA